MENKLGYLAAGVILGMILAGIEGAYSDGSKIDMAEKQSYSDGYSDCKTEMQNEIEQAVKDAEASAYQQGYTDASIDMETDEKSKNEEEILQKYDYYYYKTIAEEYGY